MYQLNTTFHKSLGKSPMEALFGRSGSVLIDWPTEQTDDNTKNFNHNPSRTSPRVSDFAFIKNQQRANKLSPRFVKGGVVVEVSDSLVKLDNKKVVNIKNCKFSPRGSFDGGGV